MSGAARMAGRTVIGMSGRPSVRRGSACAALGSRQRSGRLKVGHSWSPAIQLVTDLARAIPTEIRASGWKPTVQ
ncbi:MAG: hypothetical protein QOE61_4977 [Micromonosporaceae bacterium]|jgi:hypothetical protein|nr:hypothetical protein [Micromonosporaceae bacterium]